MTAFSFHTNLNDQEQKINSMKSMALLLGFWFLPREGEKEGRREGPGLDMWENRVIMEGLVKRRNADLVGAT